MAQRPVAGRRPFRTGRVVVAIVAAVVVLLTGVAWHGYDSLVSNLERLGGLGLGGGQDGAVDILLVGMDSRTDAHGNPLSAAELAQLHAGEDQPTTNTDTIILIRIPNDGSSATAMSIPRDSYVDIPGIGTAKINSAYGSTKEAEREKLVNAGASAADVDKQSSQAGREALIKTVARLTGITVDHYAEVGLLGFVLVTDVVGGVDVCLTNPVDEPLSGADFPAGKQTLGGAQALSFVRQRHDLPRGDLDRIVRQQVFMASLAHKVLSAKTLSNPSKLGHLGDAVTRSVTIDSDWDVLKFAKQLQDLAGGEVKFQTIPVTDGNGTSADGQSVVLVDPPAVRAYVSSLLHDSASSKDKTKVDPASITVDVANDSGIDGLASRVAEALADKGFKRGKVGNNTGDNYDSSVVLAANAHDDDATAVARALGGLPVRADTIPPGSVRVMLATDYAGPGAMGNTGETNASAPAVTGEPAPAPAVINAGRSGPKCVN